MFPRGFWEGVFVCLEFLLVCLAVYAYIDFRRKVK